MKQHFDQMILIASSDIFSLLIVQLYIPRTTPINALNWLKLS